MFNVVLFQPEIPPNTGNAIRLAANSGVCLHLIRPLGFDLSNRQLTRAGLDYHDLARVQVHDDWACCLEALGETRVFALSTRGDTCYDRVAFRSGDTFVFGPETRGLSTEFLASISAGRTLRVPMMPSCRSMNLSNTIAIVVFEAWRQLGFSGSPDAQSG